MTRRYPEPTKQRMGGRILAGCILLSTAVRSLVVLAACSALPRESFGPTPSPYASVAVLLEQHPSHDELVEIDAFYSKYLPGTYIPVVRPGEYGCPRFAAILADKPLPSCEPFNDDYICANPPEDVPVVDVVMPWQIVPGKEILPPSLPYHARYVGHLGDSRLAHCWDAERIFVVDRIVTVYEERFPTATP